MPISLFIEPRMRNNMTNEVALVKHVKKTLTNFNKKKRGCLSTYELVAITPETHQPPLEG